MTTLSPPRLVRMALGMFPAAFRARYGREIWQCIRDARYELGDESLALTIRFWIGIMADLARSAVMERYRSVPRESYYLALRRTSGAVLIAAALVNVGYDAVSVKVSMGVFAALLTAVGAITGTMLIRKTLVILTFAATMAEAQPAADTVARLDTIAQHLTRIGRANGESIWPGFRPDTIPVAFVFPTHGTALFSWRGILPEGYAPVSGIRNGAWRDQRALGAASTGAAIAGRAVAQVVVSSLDPAVLLPTAVHEAFHVFQAASVKPARRFGRGENAFYVSSYPVFDAENEMMFAREGELLEQALRTTSLQRKRETRRHHDRARGRPGRDDSRR